MYRHKSMHYVSPTRISNQELWILCKYMVYWAVLPLLSSATTAMPAMALVKHCQCSQHLRLTRSGAVFPEAEKHTQYYSSHMDPTLHTEAKNLLKFCAWYKIPFQLPIDQAKCPDWVWLTAFLLMLLLQELHSGKGTLALTENAETTWAHSGLRIPASVSQVGCEDK